MKAAWKSVGKSIILSSVVKKSHKRISSVNVLNNQLFLYKYNLIPFSIKLSPKAYCMHSLYVFYLFSVFTYGFLSKKMFNFFNTKYHLNEKFLLKTPKHLKVWNVSSLIPFGLALSRFSVYNGKSFTSILWTAEKEGFRFGEFVLTTSIGSKIHKSSV